MTRHPIETGRIRSLRRAIDAVDDALVLMIAARRALVQRAALLKHAIGDLGRDPERERQVMVRAQSLAAHLAVPTDTARLLMQVAIADALQQQGLPVDLDQDIAGIDRGIMAPAMPTSESEFDESTGRWLRLLPPPKRLAPLLRAVPKALQGRWLERAMLRVLAAPLSTGLLDFMRGRRLGIEVSDLNVRWVIELCDRQLRVVEDEPEASVRGSVTDLLLLASRLEDADTLFFQRRLTLTGDTELGLTVRNLLERLPWDSVPLSMRIVLNRGARLARAARAAHQGEA